MNKAISLIILLVLFSCGETFEFNYLFVDTGGAVLINDTTAQFLGNIENYSDQEIIESGFIWGLHSGDKNGFKVINPEKTGIFKLQTNHALLPNKTYYVRAFAKTEFNTVHGLEILFDGKQAEINTGSWSEVYFSDQGYWCEYVETTFSINDVTYILLEDGSIYEFNHTSMNFNFLKSSDVARDASYSTVYQGNAYVFAQNSFFKFNPNDISFTKLSERPSEDRWSSVGFSVDHNFYIGLGSGSSGYSKEFWHYDLESDLWQQIQDFPGDFRKNAFSYNINNYGYVGGGYNLIQGQWPYPKFNDLWLYNPLNDEWIEKESLPFENEELFDLEGVNLNNIGYSFYHNKLYEYNHIFDIWEEMADLDYDRRVCYPHLFVFKDQLFILEVSEYIDDKFLKMWSYEK